ncbi:MAG: GAF domain-containing protein [Xanthomonadales bacterium]|nr:GAF domain-containing protein [Xanthomonadales bacterium]
MDMPNQELRRLDVLRMYRLLDTAAEKSFDELTRLAASICDAPISLISLVDENRQWFKSRHGLDALETPREQAFCAHVIAGDEVMVVEDATRDSRFEDNPLVTGDPNIRFYAGAPLKVESGFNLGTLCVIDRVPRTLSEKQLEALEILRNAVVSQIELRRSLSDLEAVRHLLPVCAWCRSVKVDTPADEPEQWEPLHQYLTHTASVTHGICPSCLERQRQNPDQP